MSNRTALQPTSRETMTEPPRRRTKITGTWVFFESRDTKLATVSWHPRYKERYRTKAQP
jgi:hypothetical protein